MPGNMTSEPAHGEMYGDGALTLGEQINIATRPQHTSLNRLITSRLPLCLPPNTTQPDLYLLGLSYIAEIFYTLETAWDEITNSSQAPSLENTWDNLEAYAHQQSGSAPSPHEDVVISALRTLRPLGLSRSERLRNDIQYLQVVCGLEVDETRPGVAEIKRHIEESLRENPILLVAYAWTLYLAVFSGGRWIRGELCKAGQDFWLGKRMAPVPAEVEPAASEPEVKKSYWTWKSPVPRLSPTTAEAKPERKPRAAETLRSFEGKGLSLWFFPGTQDGEEIRHAFKTNVEAFEGLLSDDQRRQIVAESKFVFKVIGMLVGDLDALTTGESTSRLEPMLLEKIEQKDGSVAADMVKRKPESVVEVRHAEAGDSKQLWWNLPGYTGVALAIGCVSWYAMYHAGTWNY